MSGAVEQHPSGDAVRAPKLAPRSARSRLARLGVLIALAGMTVLATVTIPGFLTPGNLTTILLHVSINAVLALGMTFVIVTAGIDLSVGSIVALCGVLAAKTLTSATLLAAVGPIGAAALAVAVGFGVGAGVGALNGSTVAYLRVAPFIVTLATMTIAHGTARLVTGGIEKGDLAAFMLDLVSTDMLSDAAGFAPSDIGMADGV